MKRLLLLFTLLVLSSPAHALCLGTVFSGVGTTYTFAGSGGEYNVFDPTEYMQTVNFNVTSNITLGACKYYIVLTAGGSGNTSQRTMTLSGQPALNYNAYTTGHTIFLAAGAYNGAGVISGTFPSNGTNPHSFYWTIAPGQVVHANASRYQDTNVTLGLYAELAGGIYTLNDFKTITFQAKPMSSIDLSLVDSGGSFNSADNSQTVSFGTLATGGQLSYDTMVRSNDGYIITMQSANAQKLKHASRADTVDYTMTVGGVARNLSGGGAVTVAQATGVTSATGTRFATQFTIGTMTGSESPGTYSDTITLTLSAN